MELTESNSSKPHSYVSIDFLSLNSQIRSLTKLNLNLDYSYSRIESLLHI